MEWIFSVEGWIAFITLTLLEIVLGIDNIIFISVISDKLPAHKRERARVVGLIGAATIRIVLLLFVSYIMKLTEPLFYLFGKPISWKSVILIGGGLFLIAKSTIEIYETVEVIDDSLKHKLHNKTHASFFKVIINIIAIDIVFSLDSVITAVGMVEDISIMISAIVVAVIGMIVAISPVSKFINNHPSLKILALSFLILIGVALIGEGINFHIPKTYIYFAMAYSLAVEMINMKIRTKPKKP